MTMTTFITLLFCLNGWLFFGTAAAWSLTERKPWFAGLTFVGSVTCAFLGWVNAFGQ